MDRHEFRSYPIELRLNEDGPDGPTLEGHAAVFNELSEDFGGWRETIAPGAFTDAIKKGDVRALWNHNSDFVLGRQSADTLSLEEDKTGLAFRIKPPTETTWFQDRVVSLKRGDVTGASFGFWVETDEWKNVGENEQLRTILKIRELLEISPGVTFPAYPQTDIALRSLQAWRTDQDRIKAAALQAEADVVNTDLRRRRNRLREMASR